MGKMAENKKGVKKSIQWAKDTSDETFVSLLFIV
jgi:hypothetical protein